MADTTFSPGTVIASTWLNDINDRVYTDTLNVRNAPYGATGDGITNDTAAFTAAVSAFTGGIFYIPPGHYKLSSATSFSFPSNTSIIGYGATLDFTGSSAASRLKLHGSINSDINLTSDVAAGTNTLPMTSVVGLSVGDLLLVHSNRLVPLGYIGGTTTETIGEFVKIQQISGLNITIEGYLDTAYATADVARAVKVNPVQNSSVMGLKIIGVGTPGTGVSSAESGISVLYGENITIKDCVLQNTDYNAIRLDQTYGFYVNNNTASFQYRGSPAYTNVIQYGVSIIGATSRGCVSNNKIIGAKHGVAWSENSLPGVSRDVSLCNNSIFGTWAAGIATHESNDRFQIYENIITNCERGLDIRVRNGSIFGNVIRGIPPSSSIGDGIFLQENCGDLFIANNTIDGCRYGIRMYNSGLPSGATPERIKIVSNSIRNVNQIGIQLQASNNANTKPGFFVKDNTITDCGGDFVEIDGPFTSPNVVNNVLEQEDVVSVGFGIDLLGTTTARISDNMFIGMIPMRTNNDTQGVPVAPANPLLINNTYTRTGGFVSATTGTNIVQSNNIQTGNTSIVIAAGIITVPSGIKNIIVDTEGAGATDDLVTINGGNTGDVVTFTSAISTRDVTFKDTTGNLQLAGGDFTLDNLDDTITLIRSGSGWREIARSNNT